MKGFKNVYAYIEGQGIIKTDIAVENGKISAIANGLNISEPFPYNDGETVVAGFIDEHIHGANGSDAMDGTEKSLSVIANALAMEGTTSFLATTMTNSKDDILKALTAVKEYVKSNPADGAEILGVHLEGPFISENHIGAQPLKYLSDPDGKTYSEYFNASGKNIKIVSLAPEENGGYELIEKIVKDGVIASAGHTDAGYNQIKDAMKFGLNSITHTFNAMRGIHHREIGTAGCALLFDELYTECICDGIHLSLPCLKLLIKNKPKDKLIMITDSMRAKYLPDGESELGGQKVIVKNGEARLVNGALAGSTLKMNIGIKNLVEKCGVTFTDAIDYATLNPAKHLKVDGERGSVKVGKNADFAVLAKDFSIRLTVRNGNVIYKA